MTDLAAAIFKVVEQYHKKHPEVRIGTIRSAIEKVHASLPSRLTFLVLGAKRRPKPAPKKAKK